MQSKFLSATSNLYCPNHACVASGSSNVGLKRPLLEFPVDPNHVRLACPFCRFFVTQCDGCCALILDDTVSNPSNNVQCCRKCGFPNILDSVLRKCVGLPTICPLSYDTARILQRAISEELYRVYKFTELKSIQSMVSEPKDDFIIVGRISSKNEHQQSDIQRHHSTSSVQTEYAAPNDKKRRRVESVEEVGDANSCQMDLDVNKLAPQFKKSTTKSTPSCTSGYGLETDACVLTFNQWTSKLEVALTVLTQVLRTQLHLLDSSICKEHDDRIWKSMHWQDRAQQFLLTHGLLLRTLIANSPDQSDTNSRIHQIRTNDNFSSPSTLSTDFFDKLADFLQNRPNITVRKAELSHTLDFMSSLTDLIPRHESSGAVTEPPRSSLHVVFNLIESRKNYTAAAFTYCYTESYDQLLFEVASEIRSIQKRLSSLVSTPHTSTENPSLSEQYLGTAPSMLTKENLVKTAKPGTERKDTFEHYKLTLLLLHNLHKSIAAVIL